MAPSSAMTQLVVFSSETSKAAKQGWSAIDASFIKG